MTRHLALVGCTATGKSTCALAIARSLGDLEVVSLDSMQVYRGLDIGTAKPTLSEQAEVAHHLIDVVDPAEDWSVRETQRAAAATIADIEARGRRALLVGGTGLYVRAVVDDLDVPPTDANVRAALDARPDDLYAELQRLDPLAASRIEPDNRRRTVRALEVIEITGRPFSSYGPGLTHYGPPAIDVQLVGLALDGETLHRRITERFVTMRERGLVDEVRALVQRPLSRTARQAIGYKEVISYLNGEIGLDDALELAVRRTRQFARRQRVWFARDPRITWIDATEKSTADAEAVMARWFAPAESTS